MGSRVTKNVLQKEAEWHVLDPNGDGAEPRIDLEFSAPGLEPGLPWRWGFDHLYSITEHEVSELVSV